MKIWLINVVACSYDQYDAFVIAAKDENEALETAYAVGATDWSSGYMIIPVGFSTTYKTPQVILGSFNAG